MMRKSRGLEMFKIEKKLKVHATSAPFPLFNHSTKPTKL